jgi:2,4-dienoyl-CoA reductase-like NADH-dependent reductase (Old Yellow Enzyme family)
MTLFSPLRLRDVTIPNRVVVSPMSQYSAVDGIANDWHQSHLGRFALGGAGLIFTEATAVEERGRRTPGDLGLWRDDQVEPLARIAAFIKDQGSIPAVQLAHAGRKASERRPWHGKGIVDDEDIALRGEAPWPTIGPTAESFAPGWHTPSAMTTEEIGVVVAAFRDAAARADAAGFEVIEVYAAHGFLLHQFYSPACNTRTDGYGNDFQGRTRFACEVADAIRSVWPEGRPLFFRVSAVDWVENGWTLDDTMQLAARLSEHGVDLLDCSSGGIGGSAAKQPIPAEPGFQVPFAERVRMESGLATMAVGLIRTADQAEAIVHDKRADLVAIGREHLQDPNWALHAASVLGVDEDFSLWQPQFGWWLAQRERASRKARK